MAIFISDNPAAAEVCPNRPHPKLALNVIFPVGQVPDLPSPNQHYYPKRSKGTLTKIWL